MISSSQKPRSLLEYHLLKRGILKLLQDDLSILLFIRLLLCLFPALCYDGINS